MTKHNRQASSMAQLAAGWLEAGRTRVMSVAAPGGATPRVIVYDVAYLPNFPFLGAPIVWEAPAFGFWFADTRSAS